MSYNTSLWEKANSILENIFDKNNQRNVFNAYLKGLSPETEYQDVLYLRASSQMQQSMVRQRFLGDIEAALSKANTELYGKPRIFRIEVLCPEEMDSFLESLKNEYPETNTITLNPNYTFESFVVGNSNKMACAASRNVSEQPGMAFNPLFIYGSVGLGKTHLMHAIGNKLLNKFPGINILYTTSESFISEFVDSLRTKSQGSFKSKFRNVDVLMIDDVQFIAKGDASQEELFHTFNSLWENHKQLIFTSDRTPQSIPNLEDRLCSRFQQGLVVQIEKPDYETRIAILRDKVGFIADQIGYHADVDDEVLYYIASKEDTNIRELEGALRMLFAHAQLLNQDSEPATITMELASTALTSYIIEPKEKIITPELVLKTVCNYYSITLDDIKSSRKNKEISNPRQVAMYLLYSMCNLTYKRIATLLEKKDHTTVLYAVDKLSERLKTDAAFKNTIEDIKHKIKEA